MANSSEREKVRPLHTEHIHVERKAKTPWLWLLLPLLIIGALAWAYFSRTPADVVTTTTTTTTTQVVTPRTITYKDRQWEIKGEPATFLPGEVKAIGTSAEGDSLFFNAKEGYMAGSGSEAVANTISTPSGRVYLKDKDGSYQPLFIKP